MINKLPKAKSNNIVVRDFGKETLIYDLTIDKAYNLNETASIVYQACDGQTTFDKLKRQSNLTEDIIFLTLDELRREDLLDEKNFVSPFDAMSRREAIRKVGMASFIMLPLISTLTAPTALMAQSNSSCVPAGSQATATAPNTDGTGLLTCLSNASQKCCNVPPFAFQSSGPNVCDGFSCTCTYDCE